MSVETTSSKGYSIGSFLVEVIILFCFLLGGFLDSEVSLANGTALLVPDSAVDATAIIISISKNNTFWIGPIITGYYHTSYEMNAKRIFFGKKKLQDRSNC